MDMNKLKEQFQAITKYEIGSAKKDDWDGIVPIDVEGLWNWIESKLAEYEKRKEYCRDCLYCTKDLVCENILNRAMMILEDDERFFIYPKFSCNKFEEKLSGDNYEKNM